MRFREALLDYEIDKIREDNATVDLTDYKHNFALLNRNGKIIEEEDGLYFVFDKKGDYK